MNLISTHRIQLDAGLDDYALAIFDYDFVEITQIQRSFWQAA
jgi:hypothetical protein